MLAAHGLIFRRRNDHVKVNAVQQGAGDLLHIPGHLPVRTGAPAGGMAPPSAPAGVHGAYQLEAGGQMQRASGPGHGDLAVFQGLAQGLQNIPVKFRELVQKQHAVVGQGDFPGPKHGAAAGKSRGGSGVMGAAEGPPGQQGVEGIRQSRHGPHPGYRQGLLAGHVRQNGGQALGQHGLAGAGRADEQQVVAACGGNLQGAFSVFLPHDVLQIRQRRPVLLGLPYGSGGEGSFAFEMRGQGGHVRHAVDRQAPGQSGFGGVFRGNEQRLDAGFPGGQCHGQDAADAPQRSGEGELAQKRGVFRRRGQLSGSGQDSHKNGQIIQGPGLLLPRGGQVDRNPADREAGAAVFHRCPHPFPGLPDRRIRQSHDIESGKTAGEKTLGLYFISCDSVESQRPNGHHHDVCLLFLPAQKRYAVKSLPQKGS